MPYRKTPIVTNEIYHVFNRGIDRRPTFTDKRECQRALETIRFYRFISPPVKLSRFLSLPAEEQIKITQQRAKINNELVDILSFCLMPNHFHFLLRQSADRGISIFISQLQNSFTRYFNTKHERVGPLFLDQFKTVRIETDEQFIHVSRYIHLNPYSSFVIKDIKDLESYQWSSFPEYIAQDEQEDICKKDTILSFFKNTEEYKKFVFDQADYQRELDRIKHLIIDDD